MERCRHISPHPFQEMKNHLQEMLEIGAIRKSFSQWASRVALVRKNGDLRFCINLHNSKNGSFRDSYALPNVEDTLHCLSGAIWFSTLDLKAGYWQWE